MSELRELYQQVILDHNKNPRNRGRLENPSHQADGHNPLCGDKIRLDVQVEGESIGGIAFEGSGCAISTASASMMTQVLKGKPVAEARQLFEKFHDLVTGKSEDASLGKLGVFAGVKEFPMRVKCASLSWHTLMAALDANQDTVSTE